MVQRLKRYFWIEAAAFNYAGTVPKNPQFWPRYEFLFTFRPHTSVPGPEEDEMAPQNVSFIDSSAEDNADDETAAVNSASKRLSQLNITSGSKTYRVVHTNASNR